MSDDSFSCVKCLLACATHGNLGMLILVERGGVLPRRKIGISSPNNQRQHRTLHIQKDVLPCALCQSLCPVSAAFASIFRIDSISASHVPRRGIEVPAIFPPLGGIATAGHEKAEQHEPPHGRLLSSQVFFACMHRSLSLFKLPP